MIIIEPFGGLANRMRVIASAIYLSNHSHRKIKLIWIANADLNCEFLDLFKPINNIEITNKANKYRFAKSSNQRTKAKRLLAYIINKAIGVDYCIKEKDFSDYIWNGEIEIQNEIKKSKQIFFQTCQELNQQLNIDTYKSFIPTEDIQLFIDRVSEVFTRDTVGVHIRRTDNQKSIELSPTLLFIDKMNEELNCNPNTTFFLATDDIVIENELKLRFGGKIISFNKELRRDSPQGIKDAVVDLYCLAKTKYILGSYWSSYSDIAARIGEIQCRVVAKEFL